MTEQHGQSAEKEAISEENIALVFGQVRWGVLEGGYLADNGELAALAK
jgi:hypothetical protein